MFPVIRAWVGTPSRDTCVLKQDTKPLLCVGWDVKPLVPCVVLRKEKGLPWCSWLWRLYAPQHLVNPYKVLHNWVSEFTYLSDSLHILNTLSTLFGRYMRYVRLRCYIIKHRVSQRGVCVLWTPCFKFGHPVSSVIYMYCKWTIWTPSFKISSKFLHLLQNPG